MQSTQATSLILLVLAIVQVTYGQGIHPVQVGDTGSFYDPQITSASKGDIVTFRFTGTFHSITQSSFEAPCSPLQGGFDSGVAGNPPQTVGPIPEWNLTILNDTAPIWFFCKVSRPVSHCNSGMVGAINVLTAGTNQSFDVFVGAAKALTSVPPAPTGASLIGVGAIATATPIAINGTSGTASSTSTSSPNSTTAASTTSSSSASTQSSAASDSKSSALSTDQKAGIGGGIVAGAIVAILLALLFMSYRRGRRFRREAAANKTLRSQSSRDMSHIDRSEILFGGDMHNDHESAPNVPPLGQYSRSRGSGPSVSESMEQDSTAGPSINIKELAAEIATYMRRDPSSGDQNRPAQDTGGLAAVPERPVVGSTSNTDSARGPGGRQLPRPPPTTSKRADDTFSVDTLPAYVAGQSR